MHDATRESPEPARTNTTAPQGSPARRVAAIVGVLAVLAALGFGLFALFVPSPPVPAGMLTATAGDDGYRQEGAITDDPIVAATATGLESRRNVMSSSAISHSGGARLFDQTLVISNSGDDLLMQRVGLALFETLRDTGRFEQVRYLPAGETLPAGERVPEIFVTLDKTAWNQSGIPGSREYEGEFVVTACDRIVRSSHGYHTTLSPPQLQFRWRASIDYTASQTGVETSGARYQAISRDLAGEIAERLTKFLDDAAEKYGTAGGAPEYCYPEHVPPPQFDFLKELQAEKIVDGPAFMRHAVTVWQTPEQSIPRDVVALVRDALDEAGWKVPEVDQKREYLRATNGEQVLVVFRENDGRGLTDWDAESKEKVYLVHTHSMSTDEMDATVQRMFAETASESALVMFQDHWHRHRDAVEAYFEQHPPTDAASWLQLARLRKKTDPDVARAALLRASALRQILHHEDPDSSMKKFAEELEVELPGEISDEMIRILGLSELREPGEVTARAVDNQVVPVWLGNDEDGQVWLMVTPRHLQGRSPDGPSMKIREVTLRGKGRMWSDQTVSLQTPMPDRPVHTQRLGPGERVEVYWEPVEENESGRLRLRRTLDQ